MYIVKPFKLFCVVAIAEAIGRYGAPEISNTTKVLNLSAKPSRIYLKNSIAIGMDGRSRVQEIF